MLPSSSPKPRRLSGRTNSWDASVDLESCCDLYRAVAAVISFRRVLLSDSTARLKLTGCAAGLTVILFSFLFCHPTFGWAIGILPRIFIIADLPIKGNKFAKPAFFALNSLKLLYNARLQLREDRKGHHGGYRASNRIQILWRARPHS